MTTNAVKTRKSDTTAYASPGDGMAEARDLVSQVRDGSSRLVERMPEAMEAARTGARDAARTVESMPEQRRLALTTLSVGLGAGLYLAGAPRLLTVLALTPALVVAATWMARDTGRLALD